MYMMNKSIKIKKRIKMENKNNTVDVEPLDKIKHEARIQRVAEMLISGHSKRQVIDILSEEWQCSKTTISTIVKETIVYLHQENEMDREHLRSLNLARLDNIFGEAESIRDKLKTIELINKTGNLYDTSVNVKTTEDIRIDIGV